MSNRPIIIDEPNLSLAWARAFDEVVNRPVRKCPPLIVNVSGFQGDLPPEDTTIRTALDKALLKNMCNTCDVSAMVIFPYKLWLCHQNLSCKEFCDVCTKRFLPRLKALNPANRLGTYFERLMDYNCTGNNTLSNVNQLAHVVDRLSGDKHFRVTGLQMTCFDPAKDHTPQTRLGFPCLQHVGISYEGKAGLVVTGFYPAQHIFARAYGNYLGLAYLGHFLSANSGLELRRIICIVTNPLLGIYTKRAVADLRRTVKTWLQEQSSDEQPTDVR